jgi:hypothetical protein
VPRVNRVRPVLQENPGRLELREKLELRELLEKRGRLGLLVLLANPARLAVKARLGRQGQRVRRE